eukprot:UN0934
MQWPPLTRSITTLLHNLANAEIKLQPLRAREELPSKKGRELRQVHRQKRHRIIASEHGVVAAEHLKDRQLEAALGLPEACHQEELVHDPVAEGVRLRLHNLLVTGGNIVRVRVAHAQVPVPLERADGAVDARIALNGHHVTSVCVHEVERELPGEVHRLAEALVELQHLLVALVAALAVNQARCIGLEELNLSDSQGP